MRGLVRLIEALILCGSVGTKFTYGSSVVRPQPVVNGDCTMHEKVPASEPEVQADYFECEWIGSERRDGDGSERVCDNRDHRPAVAVHEEGWAGCIRATGDVDDGNRRERLLGEGAYWMLIHIFGREDSAGIGPAGPRSSAGPWAANGESFSGIRFQGGKLRSSSLVDRIPLAWEAVGARVCIRTEWGYPGGPSGAGESVCYAGLGRGGCSRQQGSPHRHRCQCICGSGRELGGSVVRRQEVMACVPETLWEIRPQAGEEAKAGHVPWFPPLPGVVPGKHILPGALGVRRAPRDMVRRRPEASASWTIGWSITEHGWNV